MENAHPVILGIDTTLEACSVGISTHEEKFFASCEAMARGQTERLLPMIEALIDKAGISMQEIDAIAVTKGPGSFTGLRIGLAAAQGMALALGIPCLAYSTLEAVAASAASKNVTVAIDTKRGEAFVQCFGKANSEAKIIPHGELQGLLSGYIISNMGKDGQEKTDYTKVIKALCRMATNDLVNSKQKSDTTPLYLREAETSASKTVYRKIQEI